MKYRCGVCGYIYDDEKEKVPFSELSDDWVCPLCGAPKALFTPIEEDTKKEEVVKEVKKLKEVVNESDDVEFTPNELAILMSNLARGAEKQYKAEEQEGFSKLKEYFESIKSEVDEAKVSNIIDELDKDLKQRYVKANDLAKENGDRGAQRALTWTTKVATMVKALLERYEKEGDKMLEGKHVYVCTICGFVYIGEKAPDLCPVCKVQSFKFEEVI